jgi:integration host factor subunit alpha
MVLFDTKKRKHSLTKQEISEQISNRLRCSPAKSKHLVVETLEIIKSTLEKDEDVMISGFGKFYVKDKKTRMGRNPATNKPMKLKKRRVVTFGISNKLRDRMNSSGSDNDL